MLSAIIESARAVITARPVAVLSSLYAVAFACVRSYAFKAFGHELQGTTPAWRNCLGLLPQVCVLPPLWLWSTLMPAHAATAEGVFINVFGSIMVFDLCAMRLSGLMLAHHLVCLGGHAYAVRFAPEAFWAYFASVVALEFGSAASCQWWLFRKQRPRSSNMVYAVGHTLSNVLATIALLMWARDATTLNMVARAAPVPLTSILIYYRQKEMHALVLHGKSVI